MPGQGYLALQGRQESLAVQFGLFMTDDACKEDPAVVADAEAMDFDAVSRDRAFHVDIDFDVGLAGFERVKMQLTAVATRSSSNLHLLVAAQVSGREPPFDAQPVGAVHDETQ